MEKLGLYTKLHMALVFGKQDKTVIRIITTYLPQISPGTNQ